MTTETPLTGIAVLGFFFILGLLASTLDERSKARRARKEVSDQIDQPTLNPNYGAYIWLSVRR